MSVQAVAAKAVQRYWNKGTNRMEAPHKGFEGHGPAPQRGPAAPAAPQPFNLLTASIPQIEARAQQIVSNEITAARLPYQQRQTQLGQEQTGSLQGQQAAYGQEKASLAALSDKQLGSAKTFQNAAADAVAKAQQEPPTTPNETEGQKQQRAASRTLLSGIALGSQAGTAQRQQAEADFLTNTQAAAAQNVVGQQRQAEGEYGKRKQEVGNQEAQLVAKQAGAASKLGLNLQGEQAKLRIAAQQAGYKVASLENTIRNTSSEIAARKATQANQQARLKLDESKAKVDAQYKRANDATKKTKDALDIKGKELAIKKLLTGHPGGKPLTTLETGKVSGEAALTFNAYRRLTEQGHTVADARQLIEQGKVPQEEVTLAKKGKGTVDEKGKPKKGGGYEVRRWTENTQTGGANPLFLNMAEQIIEKGFVDAPTKQQLRKAGLTDQGWSQQFYSSTGGVRPVKTRSRNEALHGAG